MSTRIPQSFDYFLVLDFEATCDDKKKMNPQVRMLVIIKFHMLIRKYCYPSKHSYFVFI